MRGDGPPLQGRTLELDVLPTCVGMVLRDACARAAAQSVLPTCVGMVRSQISQLVDVDSDVLPTCVGMVRPRTSSLSLRRQLGSPHVRGDGPPSIARHSGVDVLPTCVGMVRVHYRQLHQARSPHVRGDGPRRWPKIALPTVLPTCVGMVRAVAHTRLCRFSPRAWGWSGQQTGNGRGCVLPTCVGMVRSPRSPVGHGLAFSPRAWGWSVSRFASIARVRRSPHVRGDGPVAAIASRARLAFSPRAWGWSGAPGRSGVDSAFSPRAWGWSGRRSTAEAHRAQVLPTCVGMVRMQASRLRVAPFSPRAWGWSVLTAGVTSAGRAPHVRGDGPRPGCTSASLSS